MRNLPLIAALTAGLFATGAALAQDEPSPPAEAEAQAPTEQGPAAAQPQEQFPGEELRETHGDWEVRCANDGQVCFISQIINTAEGAPVMRARVLPISGNEQAPAVLSVQAPLGVLLPPGVAISVDGGQSSSIPFLYCVENGCYAQAPVANDALAAFRRGAAAQVTITPANDRENPVATRMSLMGFTRAFDSLR